MRAYIARHSSFPELDLLDKLRAEHPALLGRLNAENVAWWDEFRHRPRISALTIAAGLTLLLGATFLPYAKAEYVDDQVRALQTLPWGAAFLMLLAAFRHYVLEWGAIRLRGRFSGDLPLGVRLGWLPAGIALMLATILARGTPWLEWSFAALAVVSAVWAALAAGPSSPVIVPDGPFPMNSRLVRIVAFNVFVGAWLVWLIYEERALFSAPGFIAVGAAMAASGMGRNLVAQAFAEEAPVTAQRLASGALCAVAFGLGVFVFFTAGTIGRHALLFALVFSCVLLRRAVPMRITLGTILPRFGFLLIFLLLHVGRTVRDAFNAFGSASTGDATDILVQGSITLLLGVAIATIHWITQHPAPKSGS